jgi:hypothetical protein
VNSNKKLLEWTSCSPLPVVLLIHLNSHDNCTRTKRIKHDHNLLFSVVAGPGKQMDKVNIQITSKLKPGALDRSLVVLKMAELTSRLIKIILTGRKWTTLKRIFHGNVTIILDVGTWLKNKKVNYVCSVMIYCYISLYFFNYINVRSGLLGMGWIFFFKVEPVGTLAWLKFL